MIHALVMLAVLTALPARTDQMIYDTAGVIDDAAEQRLERDVHDVWQRLGVSIVVITVPKLEGETIEEMAVRAGQTWGVGQKGEDKGLIVAFSRDDRKIFLATGYGTEGYLNDAKVGDLLDQYAVPDLRANRFSDGLVKLTDALVYEAGHFAGAPKREASPQSTTPGWLTWIGGIAGLVLLLWLARRNPLALLFMGGNIFNSGGGFRDRGGFGGGFGGGGFGGGGFGGGGAGRDF